VVVSDLRKTKEKEMDARKMCRTEDYDGLPLSIVETQPLPAPER
jgi:hypothetical protein